MSGTLATLLFLHVRYPAVEGGLHRTSPHPAFAELDPWLQRALLDDQRDVEDRYADLFRYFVAGYLAYRSDTGAVAFYPGEASNHGYAVDGLEGFSRTAPLIGAWLYSGRSKVLDVPRFGKVNLEALLRQAIEAGTNPAGDAYWGAIGIADQRVVEAADIALALWLTRDSIWDRLNADEKDRIAAWLAQSEGKVTTPGNWRLFPMLVNRVLRSFGETTSDEAFARDWEVVRAGYAGEGWFYDSREQHLDYYNAWSFYYGLYWLTQIDPGFDVEFVKKARREFVAFFRYFMTPKGLPIFGRSICYRTAATVPLVIAAGTDPDLVDPGEARRAFDRLWRYFVNRGGVVNGALSQGYCGADERIVDPYIGPASCLWGTRSLLVALLHRPGSPFWSRPEHALRVELADFDLTSSSTGLRVVGHRDTGSVTVYLRGESTGSAELIPYTWKNRFAEWLLQRPFRPKNDEAKYLLPSYRSDVPFCGCLPDHAG